MTDEIQLKIFGLIDLAERQQAELTDAIEALRAEREELPKVLRAALADEMRQSLAGVTQTAVEAENRLKMAVAWFSWRWAALAVSVALGAIMAVLLLGWMSVWQERQAVEQLRQERQSLAEEIAGMQAQKDVKAKRR